MGKRTKKITAMLMASLMSVSLLAGCGSSSDSGKTTDEGATTKNDTAASTEEKDVAEAPSGGVTLTLYGNADDAAKPYMQKIFKLYEEKTGNKIDVQGLDASNFESVCLTKFQTGDIPDILMHFGGYGLDAYNPKENFVDFTDAAWVADIADTSKAQTMRDGVVYGLPFWESSVSGCFYNKQIFEEQGIKIPTTQAEFDAACQKLVDAGIQPIYMPAADSWPLLYQFALDPIFSDKELLEKLNSNQTTYAEIPAMKGMLEWYKNCADKGYFGKDYATDTWDYCSEVLGTGEAAMMFCWDTWFDTDYDNESYDYKSEDFGLMPAFMGSNEQGTYEGGNNSLLLVNKKGDKVDEATAFIEFCADPENYNQAFDGVATTPTFKGMTNNKLSSQYEGAKDSIAKVGNPSIAWGEVIGFSQNDGGKCIQELLVGNISVDDCLKLMDDERIKIATSQNVEGFK